MWGCQVTQSAFFYSKDRCLWQGLQNWELNIWRHLLNIHVVTIIQKGLVEVKDQSINCLTEGQPQQSYIIIETEACIYLFSLHTFAWYQSTCVCISAEHYQPAPLQCPGRFLLAAHSLHPSTFLTHFKLIIIVSFFNLPNLTEMIKMTRRTCVS